MMQCRTTRSIRGLHHHNSPFSGRICLVPGIVCVWILVLAGGQILAQQQKPAFDSDTYGFSYRLPPDWEIAREHSVLPVVKKSAEQSAKKPGEVLSVACAQVVFSARHGKPPSVIVIAALPFACYGQTITAKSLPGFAAGVSDGLKQNLDITQPVYGSYVLGTHNFWVERAVGVTKSPPQSQYTVEIACTVLKKTAVCWMSLADDPTALRDFEHSLVTLDGEPPQMLVPVDAFMKEPQ